ncbi:hypothetical protein MATL_G00017530 [Megalops atlanticus]|uniref:Dickkopf N-terminal cysteine-rich domain-containing protein n=1 Tax=Megalops atlanticus TaxID=7932 RepID=A0A9D3QM35_MEGAT|nr:hypothetical protein MATL_G00017530 [Megalops atlanticus]
MLRVPVPVFLAFYFTVCGYFEAARGGSVLLNSNAIKNLPGGAANPSLPVSATPDVIPFDSGSQNVAIDTLQPSTCVNDDECGDEEFCYGPRNSCLPCKKRRKRCIRDAMCCPGNHCSNGVCLPNDPDAAQHTTTDDTMTPGFVNEDNSTVEAHSKRAPQGRPQSLKGQEGDNCLRSTDCSEGLCCARHFWSKICKPVLKEGQVCTKHRRKGTHGLEIFQRCDCGDGLSCRTQKGDNGSKASRSLHTCQRH